MLAQPVPFLGGGEGEAAIVGDEAAFEVAALAPTRGAGALFVLDERDPGRRGGAPGEVERELVEVWAVDRQEVGLADAGASGGASFTLGDEE